MAQDIFIKIEGIEGESQDPTHKGEIEILHWDWSVSQTSNIHSGSGGGAGKCTVDDLNFEHYIDKSTPKLLQHCLTGKYIPEAVLTVRNAGRSPLEFLCITLQEIIITQVSPVYLNTMRAPRETVSLAFSRVKMDYVLQNAEGNSAGTAAMGYDIKTNANI